MTSTPLRGAFAALALALLTTPALAQAPDAGPRHAADHQRMHEMMEKHHAAMTQDLHTILNIRPDQEGAFAAFQASMTPPPHDEHKKGDRGDWAALTTPQRLDKMLAKMDEHTARMRRHIEATKAFYAALSPQQQQVFDALERLHGHGGHGGWGHHAGGPGGRINGPGEGPPPPPPGE